MNTPNRMPTDTLIPRKRKNLSRAISNKLSPIDSLNKTNSNNAGKIKSLIIHSTEQLSRNRFAMKHIFLLTSLCFFLSMSSCRYVPHTKTQDSLNENSIHKEMKFIPAKGREFIIGKEEQFSNVSTPHPVLFTYNYWIDSTEVTQGDYDSLMRRFYPEYTTPLWDSLNGKGNHHPAYLVNWYDAVLYCNARSKIRGLDTIYSYHRIVKDNKGKTILPSLKIDLNKNGYRLPTEAEWEFAYRAGETTDFYWGDTILAMTQQLTSEDSLRLNSYMVYQANSRAEGKKSKAYGTQPVASKVPNRFGLYDMSGNVQEWPHNFFYRYTEDKEINPVGPEFGKYRGLRGGSWSDSYKYCSAASNRNTGSDVSDIYTGFRVVAVEFPTRKSSPGIDNFSKIDKKIRRKDGTVANDMVKISAKDCSFLMGSSGGIFDQKPTQEVRFTYDFLIGRTEVTRKEYDELMSKTYEKYETPQWDVIGGNRVSIHPKTTVNWINQTEVSGKYGRGANRPATYINWFDAALYCNALSLKDGFEPVYEYSSIVGSPGNGSLLLNLKCNMQKSGYRLPTEAEWEFAYRGGESTELFWGIELEENKVKKFAQYERNAKKLDWTEPHNEKSGAQAVGQLLPNGFGLYDMSGNAWEWCTDLHYYYDSQVVDPVQLEKGNKRIVRGGSWYNDSSYISGVRRSYPSPESRNNGRGFRVARSLTIPESWMK